MGAVIMDMHYNGAMQCMLEPCVSVAMSDENKYLCNNSGPSSLFMLIHSVYTLTFGIKSKCRPFCLFFYLPKISFLH